MATLASGYRGGSGGRQGRRKKRRRGWVRGNKDVRRHCQKVFPFLFKFPKYILSSTMLYSE